MLGADTRGGQSSKGFLHWLKNSWIGKLWNRIVNFFKSKKQKSELQSISGEQQKKRNSNDQIDESKSLDLNIADKDLNLPRENILSNPNKNRPKRSKTRRSNNYQISSSSSDQSYKDTFEERCIQKRDSNSSQTSIDSNPLISSCASQISSSASLSDASLPELLISQDRSQSSPAVFGKNDDIVGAEQPSLEWEGEYNSHVTSLQGTLLQPEQKLSSSNIEEKNDNDVEKREQSKPKIQHTRNQLKQREREKKVLRKREKKSSEDEKKRKETLEKGEKKQKGAAERKKTEDEKKSEKARDMRNRSNYRSMYNSSSSPNPNLLEPVCKVSENGLKNVV